MGTKTDVRDYTAIHLNNNLLCACRIKKSGPIPRYHDIIELSLLPINSQMDPKLTVLPFTVAIQPKRKWNIENYNDCDVNRERMAKICLEGLDPYESQSRFEEWFEALGLKNNKKLCLLVCQWEKDKEFIEDWIGGYKNYQYFFSEEIRDISMIALYSNDKADYHGEQAQYPKTFFQFLASSNGLQMFGKRDIMEECLVLVEIYKRMLKKRF